MRKIILTALMICLSVSATLADAQENQKPARPTPEQMMQYRAQSVAADLSLDDKTSEKFVKIYVEYLTAKRAIWSESGKKPGNFHPQAPKNNAAQKPVPASRQHKLPPVMTDESAAKSIDMNFERRQNKINMEQELLDLDKEYKEKFEKVLNPKQLKKMYGIDNHRNHQGNKHGYNQGKQPVRRQTAR